MYLSHLSTIHHNPHYLNRYIRLIKHWSNQTIPEGTYVEKHHICPRSMFPTLEKEKSNLVILTGRQHYVAHWLLWKAYMNDEMAMSFYLMSEKNGYNITSKIYQSLREKNAKLTSIRNSKMFKNTIHITNGIESKRIEPNDPIPVGWRLGKTQNVPKLYWITNGIDSIMISPDETIPVGWYKGRTLQTKGMISITNGKENTRIFEDEKIPDGWRKGISKPMMWITNGKKSKRIPQSEEIPKGWRVGSNKIWITDGTDSKIIENESVIPDGWSKGRTVKRNKTKWITNGIDNKMIDGKINIPDGWREGTCHHSTKGKIWITDGQNNKMISSDNGIPEGWTRGQTKKLKNKN